MEFACFQVHCVAVFPPCFALLLLQLLWLLQLLLGRIWNGLLELWSLLELGSGINHGALLLGLGERVLILSHRYGRNCESGIASITGITSILVAGTPPTVMRIVMRTPFVVAGAHPDICLLAILRQSKK